MEEKNKMSKRQMTVKNKALSQDEDQVKSQKRQKDSSALKMQEKKFPRNTLVGAYLVVI